MLAYEINHTARIKVRNIFQTKLKRRRGLENLEECFIFLGKLFHLTVNAFQVCELQLPRVSAEPLHLQLDTLKKLRCDIFKLGFQMLPLWLLVVQTQMLPAAYIYKEGGLKVDPSSRVLNLWEYM